MKKETIELDYLRPTLKVIPLKSEHGYCIVTASPQDYKIGDDTTDEWE